MWVHIYICGDKLPNMTLSLPKDVYEIVKSHKEIRWSEVARRAIEEYAKKLVLLDAITANSALTEEDIMKLDKKIKKAIHKHYMELLENETSN